TPDFATPAAGPIAAASAPATPQEIAAFEKQLDQWDAFLVFAVKQLGETVGDKVFRAQLLEILLDSRFKLVQALQSPPSASGPDPVRIVFLDEWQQLGDAVRAAAGRGALGSRGLEFLSFISAGDALFALDQAAPALGLRISDGDLRRLAHIMAPEAKGDPLQFSNGEDPELQRLFGTTEPLSNPEAMEQNPEAAESEEPSPAAATASGEPTPATAGAPAAGSTFSTPVVTGTPKAPSSISERSIPAEGPAAAPAVSGSPPAPSGTSTPAPAARSSWLMLLEPAGAYAADSPPPGGSVLDDLRKLAKLLQRAVPNQDNVDGYRNDMQSLLDLSATREIDAGAIDPRYRPLFTQMVRAAACAGWSHPPAMWA
ncbi:MAG TPA: hypothetical protein VEJ86_08775, partial [Candidatus Binataceae bacterium]|nr:hypothetical protein [Candidatus Binataceae bacterium]